MPSVVFNCDTVAMAPQLQHRGYGRNRKPLHRVAHGTVLHALKSKPVSAADCGSATCTWLLFTLHYIACCVLLLTS